LRSGGRKHAIYRRTKQARCSTTLLIYRLSVFRRNSGAAV